MEIPIYSREIVSLPLRFMKMAAIDTFQLPDGTTCSWESVYTESNTDTVSIVIITNEGKVVLVKQYRFPVQSYVLELPAGMVDKNENPIMAAKRELREELGFETDEPLEFLTQCFLWVGKSNAVQIIYLARNCRKVGEAKLEAVEKYAQLEVVELSPREIADKIAIGDITIDRTIGLTLIALKKKGLISF